MKKLLLLLAIVLLTACIAFAENILNLDYACFLGNDSLSYVEVYTSVQRSGLVRNEDDSLKANFDVVLDILDSTSIIISDTFAAQDEISAGHEVTAGQFFPQVFRFLLKPETYLLRVSLLQNDTERDKFEDTMRVQIVNSRVFCLSNLQLGSEIKSTQEKSSFVKNGFRVLPHPSGIFGTQMPMLYYYLEVYGIPTDSLRQDSIIVYRRIISAETNKQIKFSERQYPANGKHLVISDGFPVSTLRTGTYLLEIDVFFPPCGKTVTTRKKFWMHRPEDLVQGRLLNSEALDNHPILSGPAYQGNILEIIKPDSALELMKYLFSSEEAKRIKRLNADGKKQFFYNYWREREISEPNASNKYFARVAEADSRYSYLKKSGWKTDRGRVFIMYGEPDNYNRNYLETSDLDNEVWNYDRLEGGVIFIFKDVSGFGDLQLVHSTKRGEISNPKWFDSSQSNRFNNSNDITR